MTNNWAHLTCYYWVILDCSPDDHDGVVERPLGLLDELFSAAAHDDGARRGLGTATEHIVPGEKKRRLQ